MRALVPGDRAIPWLEGLGLGSRIIPLKYEVAINPDVLPENTAPDRVLRYVDIGHVESTGRLLAAEEISFEKAPSRARRLPRKGDTIVSTVRTYLRAIAHISVDDPDLVCSTGFAVVRSSGRVDPKYLYYWLRSDPVVDEICARSAGFPSGAVDFPRVGAALLTNKRRLLTCPSIIDDNTYAAIPDGPLRSRFLYLSLLLVDMASICSAGLVPTVSFTAIKDLVFALPPETEQDRIVEHVTAQCGTMDSVVERTAHSIRTLSEYRQALVTSAVTGKLDVAHGEPHTEAVLEQVAKGA